MKYPAPHSRWVYAILILPVFLSCNDNNGGPSKAAINDINLRRGEIISCGPPGNNFGTVDFAMTGNAKTRNDFNLAVELLHSFEYDESEKVFARIIDQSPDCAMAYWGVAMCSFHALWTPPSEAELIKGEKAIKLAQLIKDKSARESAYINALTVFYTDWKKTDHRSRCLNYEKAMEKLHADYPEDKEAAVFYALALDAAADPSDKTFAKQLKAGAILNALYPSEPNHPGVIHYIIHTYDYPGLADSALAAARRYAQVAPSSAHALHMPSHIFTRLGLWDECIQSNLVSVASAKCYAEQAHIKGHWDEELHGLDYLVYAYLQKGDNVNAGEQLKYLLTIREVNPANFKVAYAFAAIPSRICLENKNWKEASSVPLLPADFAWTKFPWQESIVHFTRLMGAAHTGNKALASTELNILKQLRDSLEFKKDAYKSKQVFIQLTSGEAWLHFESGQKQTALEEMKLAADTEDSTGKNPVTPGEVLPARELLGDMYFAMQQYPEALQCYEAVLQKSPNRFNSLYSAGAAAEKMGKREKALSFYNQLIKIAAAGSGRPELALVRAYLAMK